MLGKPFMFLLIGSALLLSGCGDDGASSGPSSEPGHEPASVRAPAQPNVLLVVIDTLRADRLGCYGYRRPTSPHIDRLASRSLVYDRAFANSDGTILTHISLLSSRYTGPKEAGPGSTPTLAEVFSQAGYRTYGVAANPALVPSLGWGKGFDRYTDRPVDDQTMERLRDDHDFSDQIAARSADQTTAVVLETLRGHSAEHADRPWFLFVNYLDPHDPYTERKPWSDEFRESSSQISGTLRKGPGTTIWSWVGQTLPTLTPDDVARLGELYDAEVRYTDEHLQRVFDLLDETGQAGETIILLTSDHGEVLGEHSMFTHMLAAYDAEIRVPFILRVPRLVESQVRIRERVESVDVAPTLLTLCGVQVPGSFQGIPLLDSDHRLRPTGRSYTRHTHHAVNAKQRRTLAFPLESSEDSAVLRFSDSKLYLLRDGDHMLFDISKYPERREVTDFPDVLNLINRSDAGLGENIRPIPADAEAALKSLGYIQ